jgi:L-malate glycosyltransferase
MLSSFVSHSVANQSFPQVTSLRVGILCLGGLGGSGKVATELARGLANFDASVFLLTSPEARWVSDDESSFHYIGVHAPKTPTVADSQWVERLAGDIIQQVETHNIRVLSVHYAVGLVEAALLARQKLAERDRSLSVCLTLHGSDVTKFGRDPNYTPILRKAILACDGVTAVSHWLADEAVRILGLKNRPTVIHNAIDLDLFQAFPRWTVTDNDTLNLCHVSNFRDVKRPLDAIEVLARVRGAGVPARLLMIGSGPNSDRACEYAGSLGVADKVVFLGAVSPNEVVRWLSVSDLQLVTSESESFCLAALEAMACGVPVVGTLCGGLEEVMGLLDKDMSAQLLSVPGDTAAMAAKIVQLFNNPLVYQRLRDSLRGQIERRFSRSVQLQAYGDLFAVLEPTKG